MDQIDLTSKLPMYFQIQKKIEYRSKPFEFNNENKNTEKPKQNLLDEQLKARAKKIQDMLGGEKK